MEYAPTRYAPCNCPPALGALGDYAQIYDAQVTDEDGNGLLAAFWYMDSQGIDLSQHFTTDDLGRFHWSIEGRDPETTFINVTAGPGYVPLVFTPAELIASPVVVLKKTSPSAPNLWPILALGGVGAWLLYKRGKKVAGFDPVARYKNLNPTAKTAIIVGGVAFAGYLVYKIFIAYRPTVQQQNYLDSAKSRLAQLAAENGILPSYDTAQYAAWATSLTQAFDDCGTDEATVYGIFSALRNEADIYKLIVACGVLSFKPCLVQGGVYFGDTHLTLSEAMTSELDGSEISKVNEILADHSINFSF